MARDKQTPAPETAPEAGAVPATTETAVAPVAASDRLYTQAELDTAIAAAVAAVKPESEPELGIVFHAGAPDDKNAIAVADIVGVFGNRAVVVGGIDVKLDKRGTMQVYMPGFGAKRAIMGSMVKLASPVRTQSQTITHELTPAGAKDLDRFIAAVKAAWAMADASDEPFERRIPFSL